MLHFLLFTIVGIFPAPRVLSPSTPIAHLSSLSLSLSPLSLGWIPMTFQLVDF